MTPTTELDRLMMAIADHPDVTDDREPSIQSYETDGPYDCGNPLEEDA